MLVALQAEIAAAAQTVPAEKGIAAGSDLRNAAEDADPGRPRRSEAEHLAQALAVQHGVHAGVLEQGLDFGREDEAAVPQRVEQRLDAEAVAAEETAAAAFVVHRERKDAVQLLGAGRAVLDVAFQEDFRIAGSFKQIAGGLQLPAQLPAVVELPVVDDGVAVPAGIGRHGLPAALRVDHAQPLMRKGRVPRKKDPVLVRPAVLQRIPHLPHKAPERRRLLGKVVTIITEPGNSTHETIPPENSLAQFSFNALVL